MTTDEYKSLQPGERALACLMMDLTRELRRIAESLEHLCHTEDEILKGE